MSWLSEIKNHRLKVYSQCGEEGYIEFILQSLGLPITAINIVEFGAGDGVSLSNSEFFCQRGASAMRFDGDNKGSKTVQQVWLDKEEVRHIAITCNAIKPCDVLMVDVDGNDYWFIKSFLENIDKKPSLVVCEINPIFKRDESYIMPYNPHHYWKNNDYYGMSLMAIENLMKEFKYTLVFVNDSLNAYFIPTKLIGDQKPMIEYRKKQDHPHDNTSQWWCDDLPLGYDESKWYLTTYPQKQTQ